MWMNSTLGVKGASAVRDEKHKMCVWGGMREQPYAGPLGAPA